MSTLLVTGGAGFIGAHTLVELINAGHTPIVLDDLSNSDPSVLRRVEGITGARIAFVHGDVRDKRALAKIFSTSRAQGHPITDVIHFAALKAVSESVQQPLRYYDVNVGGTIALLEAMDEAAVERIIFSSSATVYGHPTHLPCTERHGIAPTNPYGWTKAINEQILKDWSSCSPSRRAISLRYFNPIGAHPSGDIGESPKGVPNNIFPYLAQVAVGKLDHLRIFGNDYPTPDGTGVRDYLHVVDLAVGHVKALEYAQQSAPGFRPFNLGTGRGVSVLELVRTFEMVTGRGIRYEIAPRRPGDIAECWADPSTAEALLGWKATRTLEDMCADGWRWQSRNPNGYED